MRKFLFLVAIVLSLIATLLGGCDTDENEIINEIKNKNSPVSLKWRNETGFRGGDFSDKAAPVVVDDMVYVGGQTDYLYCFDKNTGQTIWRFYVDDSAFNSPAVVDDVVYVGGWSYEHEGRKWLYAIYAANGKLKWRIKLEDTPPGGLSVPTVVDGIMYIGSMNGHLYAVEAESGKLKWSFKPGDKTLMITPSVDKGVVYYVCGYYLNAIDAETGVLKWRSKQRDYLQYSSRAFDGLIYVGGGGGIVLSTL